MESHRYSIHQMLNSCLETLVLFTREKIEVSSAKHLLNYEISFVKSFISIKKLSIFFDDGFGWGI